MKIQELRIGNYLNYIEKMYVGEPDQTVAVSAIFENGIKTKEFGNTRMVTLKNFEYIPLTEEWLAKLGFEQMSSYSSMDGFHWVTNHEIKGMEQYFTMFKGSQYDRNLPDKFYIEPFEIINDNKVFINYVHQLQNLYFALTGTELITK
tara:strand:- start:566 stop:1009 length:444 start_codon:yes stop_codon:yes gene_type:complete